MRNVIASIYIFSLTILTQTGCDKKDQPKTPPGSGGIEEFETTVKLQLVDDANPTGTTVAISTRKPGM